MHLALCTSNRYPDVLFMESGKMSVRDKTFDEVLNNVLDKRGGETQQVDFKRKNPCTAIGKCALG